jgi:hypothetical protein
MSEPGSKPSRFIGIQVGAVSFIDEGVPQVLDTFQRLARVNALSLATPTWTRGTGGRQIPGHPLPDHGVQQYDLDWKGGSYARIHSQYYAKTCIGLNFRAPEHGDWDIFEAVIPEAQKRGMQSYAWIEESSYAQALRDIDNFPKVLEIDLWGRPSFTPCFNNPDYIYWHLGIIEDYCKSYPIDGVIWCSERPGPLDRLIHGPVQAASVVCFCEHCRARGHERGINAARAVAGYQRLYEWNRLAAQGIRPNDGYFVEFWRILLEYPEILAWEKLWSDSQHDLFKRIYGTVKAIDQKKRVGLHIFHTISFSPWFRAEENYAEMKRYFDFLKVVMYNNCAGPRFHRFLLNLHKTLFADATPAETYPFMLKILGYDEAPFEQLPQAGFSAEYVRRETERAVRGVNGEIDIYPGIDIDIPTGPGEKKTEPQDVREAVKAAFRGGATGVILSRKYSEMQLKNLAAVGEALDELDRGA